MIIIVLASFASFAAGKNCNTGKCRDIGDDCCVSTLSVWGIKEEKKCADNWDVTTIADDTDTNWGDLLTCFTESGLYDEYTCCEPESSPVGAIIGVVCILGLIGAIFACTKCGCCKQNATAPTMIVVGGGGGVAQGVAVVQPAAQVAVAVPAKQAVTIQVPMGVSPGQTFQVNMNGKMHAITCPPNAMAGTSISVML